MGSRRAPAAELTAGRARRAAALALVAIAPLALGLPARAQPASPAPPALDERARPHLEAGLRAYEAGDFATAVAELEAGLAIDPAPVFRYALGQVERRRGDFGKAIAHYEAFLAAVHDPQQAEAARIQLARCREALAAEAPPPSPPSPPPPSPTDAPPAEAPAEARPRWWTDGWGGALAVVGVVGVALGVGLVVEANQRIADADRDYDAYLAAREAQPRRTAGWIVLGVGAAALGAGVARYVYVARRPAAPPIDVAIHEGGVGVSWTVAW
jgi:tetratricopeptide (TPR) repeat protein